MRFTISLHISEFTHYDLFMEKAEYLETWSLNANFLEEFQRGKTVTLEEKPPHRNIYLDYEGEISGNRGSLKIFDKGTYILKNDIYIIKGSKIRGNLKILRINGECGTGTLTSPC